MKKVYTLMTGLFMSFLFATGCDQPEQTDSGDGDLIEEEGREATPPAGIDQERTTPVKEEATEEIKLAEDTNNQNQR